MTEKSLLTIKQLLNHPSGVKPAWTKSVALELLAEVEKLMDQVWRLNQELLEKGQG